MKKISILVVALMLMGTLFSTTALAVSMPVDPLQQSIIEVVPATGDTETEADAGILPDSPFYFLKRFIEQVQLTFTFEDEAKAQRLMEFAQRRLAELEALPEEKQAQYAESLVDAFLTFIEKADDLLGEQEQQEDPKDTNDPQEETELEEADDVNVDVDDVDGVEEGDDSADPKDEDGQKGSEKAAGEKNSLTVLREVLNKVPDQAKPGIQRAIDVKEAKAAGERPGPNPNAPGQQKRVQEQEPSAPDNDTEKLQGDVETQEAPPKPGNPNPRGQRNR
ncbi:DUF5667 domain-containing protein [Dethiobacter alkaliphilus]|uniref:DUF5667 domain-containing protein n=1 Tax=Dethiobacter alkaliphilus AHT 1 TaxID=555088 RepID=C0GGU5_DETAL|nr:DUF5667 domain-containing protein [Dethiobacter alkaliphilus]EEG77536.1 hypothetical protein DealDRAFT_1659 [Dethiobacter alkaliphilus AHT 1]